MPLSARHVVVFSELSPEQKQNYTKFIIEHNVKFGRNKDGLYVASVSLGSAAFAHAAEEAKVQPPLDKTTLSADERSSDMPASMKRYASLYCLIEAPPPVAASKMFLSDVHLAKTIHDIYDARWEDARRNTPRPTSRDEATPLFALFVLHHFQTRFGLAKLVAQSAVDLMQALHANKNRLDTEIFSCFLDGTYPDDALEFYLFARHQVVVLLTKDTLGGKFNLSKDNTWISKAQCLVAANAVFGSRLEPSYLTFLRKLKRHLTAQPASRANTHIIEMNEFLLLALETFQATQGVVVDTAASTTMPVTKALETVVTSNPNQHDGDEQKRLEALLHRVRARQLEQNGQSSTEAALSPKVAAMVWPTCTQ